MCQKQTSHHVHKGHRCRALGLGLLRLPAMAPLNKKQLNEFDAEFEALNEKWELGGRSPRSTRVGPP
jgi:hypothetical protein